MVEGVMTAIVHGAQVQGQQVQGFLHSLAHSSLLLHLHPPEPERRGGAGQDREVLGTSDTSNRLDLLCGHPNIFININNE